MTGRDPSQDPQRGARRGPDGEAVPLLRDAEPPVAGETPGDPPVAGKTDDIAPPPQNPWHQSRARRGTRKGATAPTGGLKGLLPNVTTGRLVRRFDRIRLPRFRPPLGTSWLPWLTGAVAAFWLGTTSLHPVGAHDQAVVVTAGAWGPTLGPGLAVSWPWPIGSIRIENVTSIRHLAMPDGDGEHLMLTRDGALVDVAYDLRWHIADLRDHATALADAEDTLRLSAENAVRATVAGMDFGALMGAGAGRDTLGHDAARRLQIALDRDHAGITVTGIDIRRADPPARVADALRAVVTARSDAAAEAMQAQSWSHQQIVTAQGEAGEFDKVYEQYRHAPDVTRRQMYYATMERVMAQSDKVIVDAPGTTMNLPALTPPAQTPPAKPADTGGANGH
jgi:membrane protease subunit HflK